jgi:hypothetical protein
VSTKEALKTQDTTREAGPVYDIPHGYRQMGLETRFRCSRVSTGRDTGLRSWKGKENTFSDDSERYTACRCYCRWN